MPESLHTPGQKIDTSLPEFQNLKTKYFFNLALHERGALDFHKTEGLWQRDETGEREWGNVSEHCLVEVARVQVIAQALGLDENLSGDLMTAAALHDYFKKAEKAILERKGLTWEAYEEAQQIVAKNLTEAGFGKRIVKLVGSVGHSTVFDAEALLLKPELTEDDIAWLIMHYVDDYTIGSEWVRETEDVGNLKVNDLDRRMDKNEADPRYKILNEAGREYYGGETAYQAQRRVGHLIENRLAELINVRQGLSIQPVDLPVFIDNLLQQKIIGG